MRTLIDNELHYSQHHHTAALPLRLQVENVDAFYGETHALKAVTLNIYAQEVTAFIGPSGCGKTTLLKCLNRANDLIREFKLTGRILFNGEDIYDPELDPTYLRRRFGWVAQKPNPFPKTIYENVAYGPRIQGMVSDRTQQDELVEGSLKQAGLWDEVKDRLKEYGTELSGGQQQRLCIARAIATDPEVLLMDEPCSALDPIATARVEDLIDELRGSYAIVIITHSLQQAARISQRVAHFHLGRLVECDDTEKIFTNPQERLTEDYVTGRFG